MSVKSQQAAAISWCSQQQLNPEAESFIPSGLKYSMGNPQRFPPPPFYCSFHCLASPPPPCRWAPPILPLSLMSQYLVPGNYKHCSAQYYRSVVNYMPVHGLYFTGTHRDKVVYDDRKELERGDRDKVESVDLGYLQFGKEQGEEMKKLASSGCSRRGIQQVRARRLRKAGQVRAAPWVMRIRQRRSKCNIKSTAQKWLAKPNGRNSLKNKSTVMICNIPVRVRRNELMSLIDEHCAQANAELRRGMNSESSQTEFDLLYLPIDFKTKGNMGFAFVNFTTPDAACKFYDAWNGKTWDKYGYKSKKIREIRPATIQGKAKLKAHFQNTTFDCETDEYLPIEFLPPRDGINSTVLATVVGLRSSRHKDHDTNASLAN